jgi:hypothetical protein
MRDEDLLNITCIRKHFLQTATANSSYLEQRNKWAVPGRKDDFLVYASARCRREE